MTASIFREKRPGADKDYLDDYGRNALCCAALCGHVEVARLLLEAGADLSRQLYDNAAS